MKYIAFPSMALLLAFINAYDARIVEQYQITPTEGCHYTAPIDCLLATAPFVAAPMPDNHPCELLASEETLLIDESMVASWSIPRVE